MNGKQVILRRWSGRLRTAEEVEYLAYFNRTGAVDYGKTPGNLGFQILMRALGDGVSEVTTLSWWESMEAIKAFAGDQPEIAVYYPEDDHFLVDRPPHVDHYRVFGGRINLTI
ncbi:antibiotic biosynthesis monooxygenase [Taklimakanibacter deserti]|uniref:antibiotic biosynthesis monooxygenase n=1 Tax=Taklimakanibacter deserti TaxID=2267839 RepID=UPI0034D67F69